tara:strand:- start:517 stop:654 length:138 start_codon:yes stop_codon:yes gene_type:complete
VKIALNGSHPIVVSKVKIATGLEFTVTTLAVESLHPEIFSPTIET